MDFYKELKYIYDDNYRWLIFAEAKHAAILTFLVSVIAIFNNKEGILYFNNLILRYLVIFLLCVSLLISFSSFLPFLNTNSFLINKCKKYNRIVSKNSFFYKSIFDMSLNNSNRGFANEYYDYLFEMYCTNNRELITSNEDIINQIIDISQITTIKYYFFGLSLKIVILDIVFVMALIIIA